MWASVGHVTVLEVEKKFLQFFASKVIIGFDRMTAHCLGNHFPVSYTHLTLPTILRV